MSDVTFPSARFKLAGGTPAEIDQLEREFDLSDLGVQQGMAGHFESQSTGGLTDYLENLREIGHFTDAPQTALIVDSGDSTEFVEEAPPTDVKTAYSAESAILE